MWSEIEGLDGLIKFTGVDLIGRVVEWQCLGNNLHCDKVRIPHIKDWNQIKRGLHR